MSKWIDELGDYLAKERPDKFRLSKDRNWLFKTKDGWIQSPHHYTLGIILALGGLVGLHKSEEPLGKLASLVITGIGTYLVLEDIEDLKKDIKRFLN